MKKLTYLAVPYTHEEHHMMVARHMLVNIVAAQLMSQGVYVFSPISHTHPIAEASCGKLPRGWDFWEGYDTAILSGCEKVIVLRLPGWDSSTGVQAEIKIATKLEIPIEYIDFGDMDYYEQVVNICKVNENIRQQAIKERKSS
jgi:hypothetical protein